MMQLSDIIQLVVLCALIFFPLGYLTRHYIRRIRAVLRMLLIKPRYVKPVGTWRSASIVKAKQKDD